MTQNLSKERRRSNPVLQKNIKVVNGDLFKQDDLDAIIVSLPSTLSLKGALVNGAVKAAGQALDDYIVENIFKPKPGQAYLTPGFNLPVNHVIFVITPKRYSDFDREDRDLLRAYRAGMKICKEQGFKKAGFPALGTGRGKYPVTRAARLAFTAITNNMYEEAEEIRIVCDDDKTFGEFSRRVRR